MDYQHPTHRSHGPSMTAAVAADHQDVLHLVNRQRTRRALVGRRREQGLSQADVAALVGTTEHAVVVYETRPDADAAVSFLRAYALAIGCELHLEFKFPSG